MQSKQYRILFLIVQWATICVFLGRAYQHLFWDAPFRALLWDEEWMNGIVSAFTSMSWTEYSTSLVVDKWIQGLVKGFGILYLLAGITALLVRKLPKITHHILWIGSIGLVFLAALYCKEKFYTAGQFLEYSLQFSTPVLLFYVIRKEPVNSIQDTFTPRVIFITKILIALTFMSHGLYALNYYPIPGGFMDMTINILGVDDTTAKLFLKIAGILDFVAGGMLFLPKRFAQIGLGYCIFWGFGTAIARIWAHFYWHFPMDSLHQWAHETVYRTPHFLIPLLLFLVYQFKSKPVTN